MARQWEGWAISLRTRVRSSDFSRVKDALQKHGIKIPTP